MSRRDGLRVRTGHGREKWKYASGAAPFALKIGGDLVFLDDADPETYGLGDFSVAHYPSGNVQAVDLKTGQRRWHASTGNLFTYLAVADNRLFVGVGDNRATGPGGGPPGRLLAFDAHDGKQLWSTGDIGSVHSPPVVHDGTVIVPLGHIVAFDARSGAERWRSDRFSDTLRLVDGVAIGEAGYGRNAFFGLDAATGKALWSQDYCDCAFSAAVDGRRFVLGGVGLAEVDPRTGSTLWSIQPDSTYGTLTPAIAGDWMYIGSAGSGTLFAYR